MAMTSDPHIVSMSILFVAFCDPAAAVFGIMIPSSEMLPGKTVSGCIGGAAMGLVCSIVYSLIVGVEISWLKCAIVAVLAEFLYIPKLDDNVTITVFATLLFSLISYV
jgi:dolichol kinase